MKNKEKKSLSINPFVLIFSVVVVAGLMTFIIQPGVLENGAYTSLPKNKINFNNLFNIFRAIPYGIKGSSSIVILILVVGGALEIYKKTGAIDNGISFMVNKFGKSSRTFLLIGLITAFSAIGGFLGWLEVLIPFIPLAISVILALGYDGITAVAVCIVGTMGGFIAGPTNLYTVGVANSVLQKIGVLEQGSDLFIGLGLRTFAWAVITIVSIIYIVTYARRVRKNPEKSLVSDVDNSDIKLDISEMENAKLELSHILVLSTIFGAMILTVIGMKFGINDVKWSIDDVSGIFFLSGILSGIIGKMKATEISDNFLKGASVSIQGAMIVGVARGVYWILDAGNINATIIHNATELLKGSSTLMAALGIVVIVSLINGLVPSGSGKAALLAPILIPIGLSLGLEPQTSVLAYQFGDGITNMFWFSYGTLLIFLNYGNVPLNKWYKFFLPLMFIFFGIAALFLYYATSVGY